MSEQGTRWVRTRSKSKHSARLLLFAIADRSPGPNWCEPFSVRVVELMADTGLDKSQIWRALKELEALEELEVCRRRGPGALFTLRCAPKAAMADVVAADEAGVDCILQSTPAPMSSILQSTPAPMSSILQSTPAPMSSILQSTPAPMSSILQSTPAPMSSILQSTPASPLTRDARASSSSRRRELQETKIDEKIDKEIIFIVTSLLVELKGITGREPTKDEEELIAKTCDDDGGAQLMGRTLGRLRDHWATLKSRHNCSGWLRTTLKNLREEGRPAPAEDAAARRRKYLPNGAQPAEDAAARRRKYLPT